MLGSCANSTGLGESLVEPAEMRPQFPPEAEGCHKVGLPGYKVGDSWKVFGMKNRAVVLEANDRIGICRDHYDSVAKALGR